MIFAASPWWYLARSSGMIAALLLAAAFIWGVMLATQLVKPYKRAAWLLDLHRYLGLLAILFTVVHLVGLVADSYVEFDLRSILVPFASSWRPLAVTWGVAGLYTLVLVQLTAYSPIRRRLPRPLWRAVHLLSFPLLWLIFMHAGSAGTDVTSPFYIGTALFLSGILVFVIVYRLLAGRRPPPSTSASTRTATPTRTPAPRRATAPAPATTYTRTSSSTRPPSSSYGTTGVRQASGALPTSPGPARAPLPPATHN